MLSVSKVPLRCLPHVSAWAPRQAQRVATMLSTSALPKGSESAANLWKVNLLYDSGCPICLHEVRFLQKRDAAGAVKLTDITALDYTPSPENGHVTYEDGMNYIHAVQADGEVLRGVAAFRKVYEEIGLGWVYAVTKLPLIGPLADRVYDVWARLRLRITGRADLAQLMQERAALLAAAPQPQCETLCATPPSKQA